MKRRYKIIVGSILLSAVIFTTAAFIQNESRDFKLVKNMDIFYSLMRELNTFYVDEIDADKVVEAGITQMLSTLDPYTVYYSESEREDLNFITTGKYGGIGSLIRNSGDYTTITEVYQGFPADKGGIKAGDILKKVDETSLKGLAIDKVSERLKGEPGTPVTLTIERNGKESVLNLKREKIAISAVPYYGIIEGTTGYISFTGFTQNCTKEVRDALIDLKTNMGAKSVILDLRSNPGGLLIEAVEIVNLFVGPGQEVVSTKGKVKQFDGVYKTTKEAVAPDMPLVVLINRGSASASEIVAGAIQDLDRGVVLGQRSYGKGLVQVSRPLSYNAQLKVTTAKYYIPSGRCVQALDFSHRNEDGSVGVIPDSLTSEFKTKNGRTVKDGGGVSPDVAITNETLSQVASELYLRNVIFDYATTYSWKNPSIAQVNDFRLTEGDYNNFKSYVAERKFNYETGTERAMKELIRQAKREKYYDDQSTVFDQLENRITHKLDYDMDLFRDEIIPLLESEIASRYYYQAGGAQVALRTDNQVKEAISLLSDMSKYGKILAVVK